MLEKPDVTTYMYGTHATTDEASDTSYALESTGEGCVDLDSHVGQRVVVTGWVVPGYPIDFGPILLEVTEVRPAGVDVTAPTVIETSPQGSMVPARADVTAIFSEAINADTISTSTVTLRREVAPNEEIAPLPTTVSYDPESKKAIFDPSRKLRRGSPK